MAGFFIPPRMSNDTLKLKSALLKALKLHQGLLELKEGLPGFILKREDVQELIALDDAFAEALADVTEKQG